MSRLEMPACVALIAVMLNLALCLGAIGRLAHPLDRPDAVMAAPAHCGEVQRRAPLVGLPGAPSC